MILEHEYSGNIPEGDAGKFFFPKWASSTHWESPDIDDVV